MAKSKYGKQVNTLLEVLKSRPYNYSMTRSTQEVENLVLEGTQHQSPELEVGVTQQDVASYKTLIYVPALGTSSESRQISLPLTGSVDRYFNSCPSMCKACHEFFSKTIGHFTRNTAEEDEDESTIATFASTPSKGPLTPSARNDMSREVVIEVFDSPPRYDRYLNSVLEEDASYSPKELNAFWTSPGCENSTISYVKESPTKKTDTITRELSSNAAFNNSKVTARVWKSRKSKSLEATDSGSYFY
jgi:hypothetical protein